MNYDIYKHARDMAWKFLIDNNVTKLPVNLMENMEYLILSKTMAGHTL